MSYSQFKFLHVIRLDEVQEMLVAEGKKYIFPKLDGTNGIVWADDNGIVHAGSRSREVTMNDDNCGFARHVFTSPDMEPIRKLCAEHPGLCVCGEWLTPKAGHVKDYIDRQFWVFDVKEIQEDDDDLCKHLGYLPYEEYSKMLEDYGYNYVIPPLFVSAEEQALMYEDVVKFAKNNHFNLPDTVVGEGVVIKNYNYRSKYGNYEEGKIVLQEFKEKKGQKKPTVDDGETSVEQAIANDYVTASDIEKCKAKVCDILGREYTRDAKIVGMVINMAYEDLLSEEILPISKKYGKHPIVFNELRKCVAGRVRSYLGL